MRIGELNTISSGELQAQRLHERINQHPAFLVDNCNAVTLANLALVTGEIPNDDPNVVFNHVLQLTKAQDQWIREYEANGIPEPLRDAYVEDMAAMEHFPKWGRQPDSLMDLAFPGPDGVTPVLSNMGSQVLFLNAHGAKTTVLPMSEPDALHRIEAALDAGEQVVMGYRDGSPKLGLPQVGTAGGHVNLLVQDETTGQWFVIDNNQEGAIPVTREQVAEMANYPDNSAIIVHTPPDFLPNNP